MRIATNERGHERFLTESNHGQACRTWSSLL